MVVEVRLDLTLQKSASLNSHGLIIVDIQDDTAVSELLEEMEIGFETIRLVTVNGIPSSLSHILYDGDKVSVFSKI